jgi:hypothetical protein
LTICPLFASKTSVYVAARTTAPRAAFAARAGARARARRRRRAPAFGRAIETGDVKEAAIVVAGRVAK